MNPRGLICYPIVYESILYEKLSDERVRCILCERRCEIINYEKGYCGTRINVDGKLLTLVYGNISAIENRPIEIKPFFHYWPGSTALTFSTWSCNFNCPWCQNWDISKKFPDISNYRYISVDEVLGLAFRYGSNGLCSSFQEPTLLSDWNVELFKLGSLAGLYCCYVSNGYMTLEALEMLRQSGMDGLKVDVKGDKETYERYCGGVEVEKVWRNIREAKRMGIHVEVVNLVIPRVNDDDECMRWLIEKHIKEAGPETPLHFTRYFPAYKFYEPATSVRTLEKAYCMAKKIGVLFPYIGNVTGHKYENTYCPNCGETLIKRYGPSIIKYNITQQKKCPKCGVEIPIRGYKVRRQV
ncbi:MAG: radical SAM protein [Nitrososphaerota archaeon]|nr:radical SAM protein [Candidatus Bathyarchaeota archaeon]MDW8049253.1 radical SAM protein [Nitrososphaerota archaeon]